MAPLWLRLLLAVGLPIAALVAVVFLVYRRKSSPRNAPPELPEVSPTAGAKPTASPGLAKLNMRYNAASGRVGFRFQQLHQHQHHAVRHRGSGGGAQQGAFQWADHPRLVTEAAENGWAQFVFAVAPPRSKSASSSPLWGTCPLCDAGTSLRRRRVRQEVAPRKHPEPAPRRHGRGEREPQRAVPRQDEPAAAGPAPRRHAVPAGRLLRDHHHLPEHETPGVVSVQGEQAWAGRLQRERPRQAHQFCTGRQEPGPRKQSRRQGRRTRQTEAFGHVARPRHRVHRSTTAVAGRNVLVVNRLPFRRRGLPRRDEAGVRIGQIVVGGRGQGGGVRLRAGEAEGVLHGGRAAGPRRELQRGGVLEPAVPGAGLQLRRDGAGQPRAGQVPVRAGQRAAHGQPVLRTRRVRGGRRPRRQWRLDGPGLRRQRRALLHGAGGLRVAGDGEGEQEQEGEHRRLRRGVGRRRPGGRVRPVRDPAARLMMNVTAGDRRVAHLSNRN